MSDFVFSLSDSIRGEIEKAAREEGVSVDEFVARAATDRIKAMRSIAFLEREASLGTQDDWDFVMSRVPARPPLPGDEWPDAATD
jgi:hypothetical protein